ncbi:uncharacterized protein LOC132726079 [Ruditapes philippinarum]|uniref:uncharacterized protein LOC132726079 n=1 Tax=Ruditapes philippinarum TaxID=129788 RepID=UPI00295A9A69|nr:uncharacterized protein LOC132726079 [Ruditapes philippinarum]
MDIYSKMYSLTITFVILVSIFKANCDEPRDDFNSRLIALEKKLERQAVQIISLQKEVSSQENTIADLKEKVDAQDNDKKKMGSEILELKRKLLKQNRMIKHLLKLVKKAPIQQNDIVVDKNDDERAGDIQKVDKTIDKKKRFVLDTVETVAFEATIAGGNIAHHTHIDDKIVFETVSLNVGSGYHSKNGTFIAPVSGIYVFSTSVMMIGASTTDHEMHVIIEKNNAEIAGAYGNSKGAYEHSSVTATIDLQAGDAVAVTVERHQDITFYGDKLTSFTGFLLYAF